MPQPKNSLSDSLHQPARPGAGEDAPTGGTQPGIVVLGAGGQLGTALTRELSAGPTPVVALGRAELDLSTGDGELEAELARAIDAAGGAGAVVINAAAWTAVDAAEASANAAEVERVNATAPGVLAGAAARSGAAFIHVSTDYVFGGVASQEKKQTNNGEQPRAMLPEDDPAPINEYGRSKRAGEKAVLAAGGYVVRTAWVFSGPTGPGRDFLDTMAGLADRGVDPKVVDDQWGRPTYTGHLAAGLVELADRLRGGGPGVPHLLHATGGGEAITWAEFAAAIFEATGHDPARVSRIPTAEYPTPARRPLGIYLSTDCWREAGLRPLPAWQEGLRAALG